MSADVVVIGGGPAGLGAAIALAGRGVSVLVCERAREPGNKPCGEGLLPSAVRELGRLGVPPAQLARVGRPLLGVRYLSGAGRCAESHFAEGPGLGLDRRVLHHLLSELAARTPGVKQQRGDARLSLNPQGACRVVLGDRTLAPRLVIGADGLMSGTRKRAGLRATRPLPHRYGVRQHFRVRPWTDHVEVFWGSQAEAYVTPVGDHEVNVAFLWQSRDEVAVPGGARLLPHLLARFPALNRRVRDAPALGEARACGPLRVRVPQPARDGLLLLGDAAGYVDAVTGEGVGLAIAKARLLAHHLGPELSRRAGPICLSQLRPYLRAAQLLERSHVRLTRSLLMLRQAPHLLEAVIATLQRHPRLFRYLLTVNQGSGLELDG